MEEFGCFHFMKRIELSAFALGVTASPSYR